MFVRDGAVTPGPSRKCDITFFVKGRPKSARQSRDSTVAARSVQGVTVPSSRVSRECRSPGLRSPPFKNARQRAVVPSEDSTNLGVFVLIWLHEGAGAMTGHLGTNTPRFVPPCWGRPPFGPTQTVFAAR